MGKQRNKGRQNVDRMGRFKKVLPNKGGEALEGMSKVTVEILRS